MRRRAVGRAVGRGPEEGGGGALVARASRRPGRPKCVPLVLFCLRAAANRLIDGGALNFPRKRLPRYGERTCENGFRDHTKSAGMVFLYPMDSLIYNTRCGFEDRLLSSTKGSVMPAGVMQRVRAGLDFCSARRESHTHRRGLSQRRDGSTKHGRA